MVQMVGRRQHQRIAKPRLQQRRVVGERSTFSAAAMKAALDRMPSSGSHTAVTRAPSISPMVRMCSCPIMPEPMIPYLMSVMAKP